MIGLLKVTSGSFKNTLWQSSIPVAATAATYPLISNPHVPSTTGSFTPYLYPQLFLDKCSAGHKSGRAKYCTQKAAKPHEREAKHFDSLALRFAPGSILGLLPNP